ncbi:MAG: sigma-70 family RNA polymerase sigma factor [Myxococcota bacterium]
MHTLKELTRQMDVDAEKTLAREMIDREEKAYALIAHLPSVKAIFSEKTSSSHKTRAVFVDRIIKAVDSCSALRHELSEDAQVCVDEATALLEEAEGLRWQLALSARHLVRLEAARLSNSMLGRDDLKQHGYVGLLNGAKRFDPDKDIRFVSYARWWVRAEMTRAIEHEGRMVRLPGGAVEQLRRLSQAQRSLEQEYVDPTIENLSLETGLSVRRIRFLRSRGESVSMDAVEDDGLSLYERIPDTSAPPEMAEHLYTQRMIRRLVAALPHTLSERDHYVLLKHYGLSGDTETTMTALGEELKISRERVRQLRSRALRKMRQAIMR